jgi:hypothetical protein
MLWLFKNYSSGLTKDILELNTYSMTKELVNRNRHWEIKGKQLKVRVSEVESVSPNGDEQLKSEVCFS